MAGRRSTAATAWRSTLSDLLFKVCPKCKRLKPVGNGATLCSECAEAARKSRKRDRDYKAEYEKRKSEENPKYRKFYRSKEWRMTARKYAQSVGYKSEECDPKCPKRFGCRRYGEDVHHIVPIQTAEGWERRFDFDNLKFLCVHMHNSAHGRTFSNGWSDDAKGKAEKAAGNAEGAPDAGGEGGEGGRGGRRKVSDYRV